MTVHNVMTEQIEVSKIAGFVMDNITLAIAKAKEKHAMDPHMNTLMKSYALINYQQHFCDIDTSWHNEAFYIEDRMLSAYVQIIKAYALTPLQRKYSLNHFVSTLQHITRTHNDYSNNPKAIQAFNEATEVKALSFGFFDAGCKYLTFGNMPNTLLVDKRNSDSFDYVADYITKELFKTVFWSIDRAIQFSLYEYIYHTYTLNRSDSDYADNMQTVLSNVHFQIENAVATIYQLRYYVSLPLLKHIEQYFLNAVYHNVYEKACELNVSYTSIYNSVVGELKQLSTSSIPNPTPTLYGEYAELAEASNYSFVSRINVADILDQAIHMQKKLQRLRDYSNISKEAIDNHYQFLYQQSMKEHLLANNHLVYKAFHDCCITLRAMLSKIADESEDK